MKSHHHAQAHSLEQVDEDLDHGSEKDWPFQITARLEIIEVEPSDVGESEEGRNDGVCAPLPPQWVPNFAVNPHLSVDSFPHLNKQPDDQRDHYDGLTEEEKAVDFVDSA